jgi:hypothetical protein
MTLMEFANKHSLSVKRSRQDDTDNIVGRLGEIYQYSDSELALMLCGGPTGTGRWSRVRSKCVAAGMTLRQNGDDEGALSFDPANKKQAALAIRVTRARPKRRLSPEHRAILLAANKRTRFAERHTVLRGASENKTAPLHENGGVQGP